MTTSQGNSHTRYAHTPRGLSLHKYMYEICKSIGFVDLDVGFAGVAVGFLVDLNFSIRFALDLVDLALDLENGVRDLKECWTP